MSKAQIIEKDGKPEWAVIAYDDYRRLCDDAELLADIIDAPEVPGSVASTATNRTVGTVLQSTADRRRTTFQPAATWFKSPAARKTVRSLGKLRDHEPTAVSGSSAAVEASQTPSAPSGTRMIKAPSAQESFHHERDMATANPSPPPTVASARTGASSSEAPNSTPVASSPNNR